MKACKTAKVLAKTVGVMTAQQRQFQDLMTSLGQATEAMASVANQTATQQLSLQKRYKEWRLAKKQHKLADRYKDRSLRQPSQAVQCLSTQEARS